MLEILDVKITIKFVSNYRGHNIYDGVVEAQMVNAVGL